MIVTTPNVTNSNVQTPSIHFEAFRTYEGSPEATCVRGPQPPEDSALLTTLNSASSYAIQLFAVSPPGSELRWAFPSAEVFSHSDMCGFGVEIYELESIITYDMGDQQTQ
eukprot:gene24334-29564_t